MQSEIKSKDQKSDKTAQKLLKFAKKDRKFVIKQKTITSMTQMNKANSKIVIYRNFELLSYRVFLVLFDVWMCPIKFSLFFTLPHHFSLAF